MRRFAIDIGGTFTDLVALDDVTGEMQVTKRPSTPGDPARGLLDCIQDIGLALGEYELFVHGTTIGLNAFLEGRGADVSLITTSGFRDVYEIGRTNRLEPYNLTYRKPRRLVPRRRVFTVPERMDYRGRVLKLLDESAAEAQIEEIAASGIRSVAICLLHAYANPAHEERIHEMLKARAPEIFVSLSSRIIREYREFERTNVTVLDAYIKPLVVEYIAELEKSLREDGFQGDFMLQRSGGGVLPAGFVSEKPVETLFSGPAGGVMGALHIAANTPHKNLILGDVGGTSFDVALVVDGREQVTTDARIGDTPIMIPILDIRSIGAGGGSIAWLDEARAIHVGPRSAGADPGPVCYGRGGVEPTVTDAAVCSGLVGVDSFLGGRMTLDMDAARRAILTYVSDPLGLDVEEAADGILRIMVDNMVGLIREILTEKGEDARRFALLMYGGAGPLFGSAIMHQLEIGRVVVPTDSANFSAYGMLITDVVYDYNQTYVRLLDEISEDEAEGLFAGMEAQGLRNLEKDGLSEDARELLRSIDVRYLGLTHALTLPVADMTARGRRHATEAFHAMYERIYGYRLTNPIQVVRLNVKAVGKMRKPDLAAIGRGRTDPEHALVTRRAVRFATRSIDCPIYAREALHAGNIVAGPAIIEETASTTVVGCDHAALVDAWGNLVIERVEVNGGPSRTCGGKKEV